MSEKLDRILARAKQLGYQGVVVSPDDRFEFVPILFFNRKDNGYVWAAKCERVFIQTPLGLWTEVDHADWLSTYMDRLRARGRRTRDNKRPIQWADRSRPLRESDRGAPADGDRTEADLH